MGFQIDTKNYGESSAIRAHAKGGGGGGNTPRSKASRAAFTGMPASHGTPTWHNPQP